MSIVIIVMIISVAVVTSVRIVENHQVGVTIAITAVNVLRLFASAVAVAQTAQPFVPTVMKNVLTALTLIYVAVATNVLTASVEKNYSAVTVKPVTTVPIMCVPAVTVAQLVQ